MNSPIHVYCVAPDHPQGREGCATFCCEHCKAKLHLAYPFRVNKFLAAFASFTERHESCPNPPEGTKEDK